MFNSMKKNILFPVILLFLFACAAIAQVDTNSVPTIPPETSPGTGSLQNLLMLLIPVLVPLVIAIGKFFVPKVPGWILPIVAPALGALIDYINTLVSGTNASPLIGALLGSAGVGVREIYDQVKKRMADGPKVVAPVGIMLLCLGLTVGGVTGCKTADGQFDPMQTQQVKDVMEPFVRIPVRRSIMNSPQHSDEIGTYYRGIAHVFCQMAVNKQFDPVTLTSGLNEILKPQGLKSEDVQMLLDFKVALEGLYRTYWNNRFRAELPSESWMYNVADFFCTAIDNGLKDAGQAGAK